MKTKQIKYLVYVTTLLIIQVSCHKVTVGYLNTEYAGYEIDSLVVKAELDVTPPIEIPNPQYEEYLGYGLTPEDLLNMGIFPTIKEGGGEDYDRNRLGIPWTSTPIEGVEGTMPVHATIKGVTTDTGNTTKLLEYLTVRGNGVFSIPVQHDIPSGRYKISLTFTNEGYSKSVDDVFTVIVN